MRSSRPARWTLSLARRAYNRQFGRLVQDPHRCRPPEWGGPEAAVMGPRFRADEILSSILGRKPYAQQQHPRRHLRRPRRRAGHPLGALAASAKERGAHSDRRLRGMRHRPSHPQRSLAKPLPWPFTLGHELGGVIVEAGSEFSEDFMGKPLRVGSKVMIPPLMPCGRCYYCIHYPESANKCLTPVYYGRYLGFNKPPHLWGGFAEYVYVDLEMLPGTKIYKLPDDMPLRLGALSEPLTSCIRAFNRAIRAGGFTWGDTVVIQGSGPIGIL